mmetsp:Transcript_16284/g.27253  ORF Transcript_16284/g.27253 Transcript_16284/m.27253 type:complete len:890 (-) Transcript_16284:215-2884(-)
MAAKIGRMWEEGERQVKRGDIHEGLMSFMRAKALLLDEYKQHESPPATKKHKASSIPRILGQIMSKLNESVDKNCAMLEQNPLLALQCLDSGCTLKDVKKAYRTMILKYHPDKNQDCDTSCIFTAIQSAYERVAEDGVPSTSTHDGGAAGGLHSNFFHGKSGASTPRSPTSRRDRRTRTQQHAPPPSRQKPATAPPRDEDYYSRAGGRREGQSGDVYGMTSEQIRRSLQALAGGRRGHQTHKELAGCSREELVRRYLNARARALSTGCNETQWQQKLADLIRKERKREREAEALRAHEQAQRQERAQAQPQAHTRDGRSTYERGGDAQEKAEADKADLHRQERVARMRKELPLMSVTELRRMMNTCGIPLSGCVEKEDLLRALCKYYGLSFESVSAQSSGQTTSSYGEGLNKKCKGKKSPSVNMTSNNLREVMKSSGLKGFGGKGPPHAKAGVDAPITGKSSGASNSAKSTATTAGHAVWTRDRLKEMEKKLNGDRLERKAAARAAKQKKEAVLGSCRTPSDPNKDSPHLGFNTLHFDTATGGNSADDKKDSTTPVSAGVETDNRPLPEPFQLQHNNIIEEEAEDIISPRGQFLDADEDSDIEGASSSDCSEDSECSDDEGDEDGDEILWRQFIHHPSSSTDSPRVAGPRHESKSSVTEDMNVCIPSLDELMRSLGDFDFDFGTLEVNSAAQGPEKPAKSEARHTVTPPSQQTFSAAMFDDPNISPKDLKAARLRNIKKSNSMSSSSASPAPRVMLGVSLLAGDSDDEDDGDSDEEEGHGGGQLHPQAPAGERSSRSRSRHRPEREKDQGRHGSGSGATGCYNDSYWRDLIMYGKHGHTDTLSSDDVLPAGKTSISSEQSEPQLHSSFFLNTAQQQDSELSSPSATAWR